MVNNPPHLRLPLNSAPCLLTCSPFPSLSRSKMPAHPGLTGISLKMGVRGVFSLHGDFSLPEQPHPHPAASQCLSVLLQETLFSAPSNRLSKSFSSLGMSVLTLLFLSPPTIVHTQPLPETDAGEVPKQ